MFVMTIIQSITCSSGWDRCETNRKKIFKVDWLQCWKGMNSVHYQHNRELEMDFWMQSGLHPCGKTLGKYLLLMVYNHEEPFCFKSISQSINYMSPFFLTPRMLKQRQQEMLPSALKWFKWRAAIRLHVPPLSAAEFILLSSNTCFSSCPLFRVMVLDAGKIIEFDSPENLLTKRGHFYAMAKDAGITQEGTKM